jgi:hypothetical protein
MDQYDKYPEFLAIARSPWEAYGVSAQIKKLNLKNGIIYLNSLAQEECLLDRSDFSLPTGNDIKFVKRQTSDQSSIHSYIISKIKALVVLGLTDKSRNQDQLYIITSNKPRRKLISNLFSLTKIPMSLKFIVIDEGIGTYIGDGYGENVNSIGGEYMSRQSKYVERSLLLRFLKYPYNRIYNRLLKKSPVNYDFLFTKQGSSLLVNNHLAKIYRNVISDVGEDIPDKTIPVLFVTQTLVESGYLSEGNYINYLYHTIERGFQNQKLVIKPHPFEDHKKYSTLSNCHDIDIDIVDNDIGVEELYANWNIKSVVGFYSTSLLTASAIFNINAYTVADGLIHRTNKTSLQEKILSFRKLTSRYVDPFKNYNGFSNSE